LNKTARAVLPFFDKSSSLAAGLRRIKVTENIMTV
jgi:hypothetical protein